MPKRIALVAIGVTRDGKTVYPEVGTDKDGVPFDFSAEEITYLEKLQKDNDIPMLRALRNEGSDSSSDTDVDPTAPKTFTLNDKADVLKAEAAARGLDFSAAKTKADLVALLDANPAKSEGTTATEDEDL